MSFWGNSNGNKVGGNHNSHFRQVQIENWQRHLDERIAKAQQRGNAQLLNTLLQEKQYLERCR